VTATDHQDIVLCPGQGAQYVGMGQAWVDQSPAARETFEIADEVLGLDLSGTCFDGPRETLNRTDIGQAAIYTTSVACFRAMREAGQIGTITAAAGLSLGEFTALHLAGVFDFESGLRLARIRGQAMQDAAESTPGGSGMVALVGADEQQAHELCTLVKGSTANGVMVPANYNCPGQIVVSGTQSSCDLALGIATQMGLRATPLKVSGAFHSPLMNPATQRLSDALDETTWAMPKIPVLSNVTAMPHDSQDIASIKKRLVEQLTSPVRWTASMLWLIKNVPGRYVELAPGKVLSGLMRRIDKKSKVVNFDGPPA